MRVVVGKQDTQTPIFSDEMTHVVFSPYWNVPPNIAQGETLPEIMKDPGFLDRAQHGSARHRAASRSIRRSIDVADPASYRFRQRPGAQNSLGLVKFMFPNQFNVYLHDTPTDSLFARASRSFSHGCVRLENPLALAEYVLRDQPGMDAGEDRRGDARRGGAHGQVEEGDSRLPGILDRSRVERWRDAVPEGRLRHRRPPDGACWPTGCRGCARARRPRRARDEPARRALVNRSSTD